MRTILGCLVVVAAAGAAPAGCANNPECRPPSCEPSLTVELAAPIADAGDYDVRVVADGQEIECEYTVPLIRPPYCNDSRVELLGRDAEGGDEGAFVSLSGLVLEGEYEEVRVVVSRGITTVVDETLTPGYETVQVGCGECTEARTTLTVPHSADAG